MRNLLTVFAICCLMPTFAFADAQGGGSCRDEFKYECKFEGKPTCTDCHKEKLECVAEGSFRLRGRDLVATSSSSNDRNDNPLFIKCSDGFKFFTRDTAIERDNKTVWINGDDGRELVTLKLIDFDHHSILSERNGDHDNGFIRKADLMFSDRPGDANRLSGFCRLQERDGHGHGPALQ